MEGLGEKKVPAPIRPSRMVLGKFAYFRVFQVGSVEARTINSNPIENFPINRDHCCDFYSFKKLTMQGEDKHQGAVRTA